MVELVVFLIAGAMCLGGALGVVLLRNPVHAALSLVLTLFGIAVLFVSQEAHFLAVVQIIVYAGAIVVLFLFVLMLLGVDTAERVELGGLPGQKLAAGVFGLGSLAVLGAFLAAGDDPVTGARSLGGELLDTVPNVEQLSISLFGDWVYAFELTSVLLVVAVIGVVVLARRTSAADADSARAADEEASR